ncbi:MAG: heavy-metal-associated domain-containing protein [Alphaproteobacteria bacterium]|nr:heavy-metal-associated domain-containing protein [Alphaproteobacteria bacterium]
MSASYLVDGMTCGGCSNSVTNAIKGKAPEAKVSIELETKRVTVDGFDDMDAIKQAVEDAGFDFLGAA